MFRMLQKQSRYRSKAFMKFCHERMKPDLCCVCGDSPWVALHHFGDDGGTSMKPSDNEVARVCLKCHMDNDLKRRALRKIDNKTGTRVLEAFQNDALKLNRAYMEHLESVKRGSLPSARCDGCRYLVKGTCTASLRHVEPDGDCALEELNLWLITEAPGIGPDEQRDWLLGWANRRSANVIGFLAEPMKEIAGFQVGDGGPEEAVKAVRFVARHALRAAAIEEEV